MLDVDPSPGGALGGYLMQDETRLAATLGKAPALRERLGGMPAAWRVREVGDGNLNLVFIVEGPRCSVIAKQALPYVRMVGESWPLPISRSHFEHAALCGYRGICPQLAPAILHHDAALALTVMEFLTPHIILRRGLMAGVRYPRLADDLATFMARTLFLTSDLALAAAAKKARVAHFAGNFAMCQITEDLVFSEPFFEAPRNRCNSPQVEAVAAELRRDAALKIAAARLKYIFLTHAEATLHGDLHSGSIMVTPEDTKVIDAEFAFCGPMSFDVGMLIANLLLSACAQRGLERSVGERDDYTSWILHTLEQLWSAFKEKFLSLWARASGGEAFAAPMFGGDDRAALAAERELFMARLFEQALGFAGLEMIRRVVGLAHVIDLEQIIDLQLRTRCEIAALTLGRALLLDAHRLAGVRPLTDFAAAVIGAAASPAAAVEL